jgi:hypothetical protein
MKFIGYGLDLPFFWEMVLMNLKSFLGIPSQKCIFLAKTGYKVQGVAIWDVSQFF